jgi:hypothetical protein
MKSPNLERFYDKIGRSVLLTEKYTEIDQLSNIIRGCRLKPIDIFIDHEKYELKLYRRWFDEFGNSLKIIKSKRINIIHNHLDVRNGAEICTDLYYGLSIDKVIKISKIVHLIVGVDEDTKNNYFLITFLGIDNYLRSYLYMYGKWTPISSLVLGIRRLQMIFQKSDIRYFHQLFHKKSNMIPCQGATEWLSCLPVSTEFLRLIEEKHEVNFSSLFTKE